MNVLLEPKSSARNNFTDFPFIVVQIFAILKILHFQCLFQHFIPFIPFISFNIFAIYLVQFHKLAEKFAQIVFVFMQSRSDCFPIFFGSLFVFSVENHICFHLIVYYSI